MFEVEGYIILHIIILSFGLKRSYDFRLFFYSLSIFKQFIFNEKSKKAKKKLNKIDFMPCLGFFFFVGLLKNLKKRKAYIVEERETWKKRNYFKSFLQESREKL